MRVVLNTDGTSGWNCWRRVMGRSRDDVDVVVGRRLRARRLLLGLSQEALGAACGLSGQQIHKYEVGQSALSCSRMVDLGAALHVPPSYFLLDFENSADMPSDIVLLLNDPHLVEIIRLNQKLPKHAQAGVLALLRALALGTREDDAGEPQHSYERCS